MKLTKEQKQRFIDDIVEVYRRHGLSLGHEDSQGAFLIEKLDSRNIDWLKESIDYDISD